MNLLNLTHSKVQWWAILSLFGIVLAFTACEKECICDENDDPIEEYPSLKVVNQNESNRKITFVVFVGYEFNNLSIAVGDSQTFALDKGMPGGYSNINVTVSYSTPYGDKSIKVNFSDGATTTITLKGCTGAEGCDGLYLE